MVELLLAPLAEQAEPHLQRGSCQLAACKLPILRTKATIRHRLSDSCLPRYLELLKWGAVGGAARVRERRLISTKKAHRRGVRSGSPEKCAFWRSSQTAGFLEWPSRRPEESSLDEPSGGPDRLQLFRSRADSSDQPLEVHGGGSAVAGMSSSASRARLGRVFGAGQAPRHAQ